MLLLHRRRNPYQARLFWWCDWDSWLAGLLIFGLFWFFVYVLPAMFQDRRLDDLRARIHDSGWIVTGQP